MCWNFWEFLPLRKFSLRDFLHAMLLTLCNFLSNVCVKQPHKSCSSSISHENFLESLVLESGKIHSKQTFCLMRYSTFFANPMTNKMTDMTHIMRYDPMFLTQLEIVQLWHLLKQPQQRHIAWWALFLPSDCVAGRFAISRMHTSNWVYPSQHSIPKHRKYSKYNSYSKNKRLLWLSCFSVFSLLVLEDFDSTVHWVVILILHVCSVLVLVGSSAVLLFVDQSQCPHPHHHHHPHHHRHQHPFINIYI